MISKERFARVEFSDVSASIDNHRSIFRATADGTRYELDPSILDVQLINLEFAMKRLLATWCAGLLLCSPAMTQQAGNLLTLHIMTVHLKPGASMEQFQDFFIHRVLPEYERQWPEIRAYMLKGRVNSNRLAVVWQFRSLAARNKYFDANGRANALELKARAGVKPIEAELAEKYGTFQVTYTDDDDWIIQ